MAVISTGSYERESGTIAASSSGSLALAASFTPAANEVIVVWFTSGITTCAPTGDPPVSGGITFKQQVSRVVANSCPIVMWTGVVPATPTPVTVSVPYSNTGTTTTNAHLVVQRFSGVSLPATPNIGSTTAPVPSTGTTGATATFTQNTAGSGIAWIGADYNGVITGTPTPANGDTLAQSYLVSAILADWAYARVSPTAGAQSYGFSSFSTSASRSFMFARIELPPGTVTPTSSRTATFDSGTIPAAYPVSYGGPTVVNGRLRVPATNSNGTTTNYAGIKSYDQASGADRFDDFFFQATSVTGSGVGNPAPSMMWVYSAGQPAGTRIGWEYDPNAGTLTAKYQVGYADAGAVALTYSSATHQWWRVRNDGTNLLWQTSPDSQTWTTQRTLATPAWANGNDISHTVEAYRTTGTSDFFEVDNINTTQVNVTRQLSGTDNSTSSDSTTAPRNTTVRPTGVDNATSTDTGTLADIKPGQLTAGDSSVATTSGTINRIRRFGGTVTDTSVGTDSTARAIGIRKLSRTDGATALTSGARTAIRVLFRSDAGGSATQNLLKPLSDARPLRGSDLSATQTFFLGLYLHVGELTGLSRGVSRTTALRVDVDITDRQVFGTAYHERYREAGRGIKGPEVTGVDPGVLSRYVLADRDRFGRS